MKTNQHTLAGIQTILAILFFLSANIAVAQANPDTLKTAQADTLKANQAAPVVAPAVVPSAIQAETPKTDEAKAGDEKKEKKGKKNEIIFYGGVNFTQFGSSAGNYESEAGIGYQLGGYYKQGRLIYWQAGARFASAVIGYKPADSPASEDFGNISVKDLDIPLTLGVNFTSFMNRVLSVRLFVSAVPAFNLGVGDNDYGITKDDVNSFIMYGQGGLGVNVAFLVLEFGYNYGFNEVLVGNTDSKPGQVFINLGFRF
jgi:hypothetical protein